MWASSVAIALTACDKAAAPDALFPLTAGHEWTYRVTTRSGEDPIDRETLTLRSTGEEVVPALGGISAWHRRSDSGLDYWLKSDDTGIYRIASKSDLDPEPKPDKPHRYVLKAPYVIGTQWQSATTAYLLMRRNEFPRELRHTHPNIPWFKGDIKRSGDYAPELCSTVLTTPDWFSKMVNNVYCHAAHHAHHGIPSYMLLPAQKVAALAGAAVALLYVLLAGFGSLQISEMPTTRLFSLLSCVTIFAALIGDLVILPAMLCALANLKPRFFRSLLIASDSVLVDCGFPDSRVRGANCQI